MLRKLLLIAFYFVQETLCPRFWYNVLTNYQKRCSLEMKRSNWGKFPIPRTCSCAKPLSYPFYTRVKPKTCQSRNFLHQLIESGNKEHSDRSSVLMYLPSLTCTVWAAIAVGSVLNSFLAVDIACVKLSTPKDRSWRSCCS